MTRIAAAAALLGLTGCYTARGGNFIPPDAGDGDAAAEDGDEGAGPECVLWGRTVFVDYVQDLSPPAGGLVTVTIRDGTRLELDVQTSLGELWAEFLGSYMERHEPLYLEVDDPRTRTIIDLIFPIQSPVHEIIPDADGMRVALVHSAAVHFLHRTHPCYEQMLGAIETALEGGSEVLVSTDFNDGQKIKDARPPLEP